MSRPVDLLHFAIVLVLVVATNLASSAQDEKQTPTPEKKNPIVSSESRLRSAKTVFLRKPRGNTIPFDAISAGFEGWGRFVIVNDESQAELIVEITAPQEATGFSVSSSTSTNASGRPEQSTKSTKEFSNSPVRMVVLDGKTKRTLWMGSEQPKSAMRHKAQEDNQVEASQLLFRKFHDRIEPPPVE